MEENKWKTPGGLSEPAAESSDEPAEFSEVELLRWIAQQSTGPDREDGDYSDRIAAAYGQKSGE